MSGIVRKKEIKVLDLATAVSIIGCLLDGIEEGHDKCGKGLCQTCLDIESAGEFLAHYDREQHDY